MAKIQKTEEIGVMFKEINTPPPPLLTWLLTVGQLIQSAIKHRAELLAVFFVWEPVCQIQAFFPLADDAMRYVQAFSKFLLGEAPPLPHCFK